MSKHDSTLHSMLSLNKVLAAQGYVRLPALFVHRDDMEEIHRIAGKHTEHVNGIRKEVNEHNQSVREQNQEIKRKREEEEKAWAEKSTEPDPMLIDWPGMN